MPPTIWRPAWAALYRGLGRGDRWPPAARGRGRGDGGQPQPALLAQARPCPRRGAAGGIHAGPRGARIRRQAGQARGDRHRQRRQGAGRDDGPLPAARLRARSWPTPPTRWRWPSAMRISAPAGRRSRPSCSATRRAAHDRPPARHPGRRSATTTRSSTSPASAIWSPSRRRRWSACRGSARRSSCTPSCSCARTG